MNAVRVTGFAAAIRVMKNEGPRQGYILDRSATAVLFLENGERNPYWCAAHDVHERITTLRYCEEN